MKYLFFLLLIAASCNNPKPINQTPLTMVEIDHKWVLVDQQNKVQCDVFLYDNGPDYASEGLFRIVKDGKIGYADQITNAIVLPPQFDCAFPFENGKAKVSNKCQTIKEGEYSVWTSDTWQYVDKKGKFLK